MAAVDGGTVTMQGESSAAGDITGTFLMVSALSGTADTIVTPGVFKLITAALAAEATVVAPAQFLFYADLAGQGSVNAQSEMALAAASGLSGQATASQGGSMVYGATAALSGDAQTTPNATCLYAGVWETFTFPGFSTLSLAFDGVDEYVTTGLAFDFERTDPLSITCWFRSNMEGYLVAKMSPDSPHGWGLFLSDGALGFEMVNTDTTNHLRVETTAATFDNNQWHQALVVFDGSSSAAGVTLYVDGVAQATTTVFDNLSATTLNDAALYFGSRELDHPTSAFTGCIDDVGIYDVELTSGNATDIYNGGATVDLEVVGPTADLQGYWYMGDGDTFPTIQERTASGPLFSTTSTLFDDANVEHAKGLNPYVTLGDDNPYMDFAHNEAFSVSVWFKHTAPGARTLCGKGDGARWAFVDNVGKLLFEMIGSGFLRVDATFANIVTGQWHHAVMTFDGSGAAAGVTLYLDGVAQAVTIISDTSPTAVQNSGPFVIGDSEVGAADAPWLGNLDDVSIHGRELSSGEVTTLFNGGKPGDVLTTGPRDALLGYWKMGDGDTFPRIQNVASVPYSPLTTSIFLNPLRVTTSLDDAVRFTNFTEVDFTVNDPFTVGVWMKSSQPTGTLISKINGDPPGPVQRGWSLDTTGFALTVTDGAETVQGKTWRWGLSSGSIVHDGRWHLVVGSYNGDPSISPSGKGEIYLDGIERTGGVSGSGDLDQFTRNIGPNSAQLTVGAMDSEGQEFQGQVCHSFVYDKQLTDREVQALFGDGRPQDLSVVGPTANLVHWSALGDGDAVGAGLVNDLSTLGNDGTTSSVSADQFLPDVPANTMMADRSTNNNKGEIIGSVFSQVVVYRGYVVNNGGFAPDTGFPDLSGNRNASVITSTGSNKLVVGETPEALFTGFSRYSTKFFDDFASHYSAQIGDVAELSFERTNTFSISAWVKTDGGVVGDDRIFSKQNNTGALDGYSLGMRSTGTFVFQLLNTVTTDGVVVESATGGFDDSAWHHVVVTYDGSSAGSGVSWVIDGVSVGNTITQDNLASTTLNAEPAQISGRGGTTSDPWSAWIDDVTVYDIELSLVEAQAVYNSGAPLDNRALSTQPNIVGYWLCGELHPGGVSTGCAHFNRQSGNGDFINMGNAPELEFERTDPFSASMWFKANVGETSNYIISKLDEPAVVGWGVTIETGGDVRFFLVGGDFTTAMDQVGSTATDYVDSSWHHLVVTNAGTGIGGMLIYIDGALEPISNLVNTLGANTTLGDAPVNIAARSKLGTIFHSSVSIDNVAVYNDVLSAGAVTALYNNGMPVDHTVTGPTADLVGYWDMETFDTGIVDLEMTNMTSGDFVSDTAGAPPDGLMTNMAAGNIKVDVPGIFVGSELTAAALADDEMAADARGSANASLSVGVNYGVFATVEASSDTLAVGLLRPAILPTFRAVPTQENLRLIGLQQGRAYPEKTDRFRVATGAATLPPTNDEVAASTQTLGRVKTPKTDAASQEQQRRIRQGFNPNADS